MTAIESRAKWRQTPARIVANWLTRKSESVVITDRSVPIGQDLDQRLAAMCDTGQAQWSGRKLVPRKPVAKLRGRGSVAQLIVEDRD